MWHLVSDPPPAAKRVEFYGTTPAGGYDWEIGFRIESVRQSWEQVSPTLMELRTEVTSSWSVQTITPTHWRELEAPEVD